MSARTEGAAAERQRILRELRTMIDELREQMTKAHVEQRYLYEQEIASEISVISEACVRIRKLPE